jgi:hypothetical protein
MTNNSRIYSSPNFNTNPTVYYCCSQILVLIIPNYLLSTAVIWLCFWFWFHVMYTFYYIYIYTSLFLSSMKLCVDFSTTEPYKILSKLDRGIKKEDRQCSYKIFFFLLPLHNKEWEVNNSQCLLYVSTQFNYSYSRAFHNFLVRPFLCSSRICTRNSCLTAWQQTT